MVENEKTRKENLINSLASSSSYLNFIDQDGKSLLSDNNILIKSDFSDIENFSLIANRNGISLKQFLELILDFNENKNAVILNYTSDNGISNLYPIQEIKDLYNDKKYSFEKYIEEYFEKEEAVPFSIEVGGKKISLDRESIYDDYLLNANVEINTALDALYSSFGDKARLVKFVTVSITDRESENKLFDIAQGKLVTNYKEGHSQINNSQSNDISGDENDIISNGENDQSSKINTPQDNKPNPQVVSVNPKNDNSPVSADPNDPAQLVGGKVSADAIFDGLAQVPGVKNINFKTATGNNLNTPIYYSNDGRNMEVTSVNGFVSAHDYLQLLKLIPGTHLDATLSDDNHFSVDLNPAFIPGEDKNIVSAIPVTARSGSKATNEKASGRRSKGLNKGVKDALKIAGATVLASALAIGFSHTAKAPIISQPVNPNPGVIDIDPAPVNPVNPVNPTPVDPVKPSKPTNNKPNNSNNSTNTTKPGNVIDEDITFPQEEPSKPNIVTPSRPSGNVIDSEITFPQEDPSNPSISEDDIIRIDERPVSPTNPSGDYEFDVDHKTPSINSPSFDDIINDLNNKSNGGSKEEESTTAPSLDQEEETPDISTPDRPSSETIDNSNREEESSSTDSFEDLRKYLEEKTNSSESTTERETESTTTEPTTGPVTEPTTEPVTEPTTGYEEPEIPVNKAPENVISEPTTTEPKTSVGNSGTNGNVIDDDINFDQEDLGNEIDFF